MRERGMRFGTWRTRELLNLLGSPDEKLKIIHVAGTNGKGSVCTYLTHILLAAGKRVGTYVTPEVFSFEEQFLIDGSPCTSCEDYLSRVNAVADGMADSPTAYERQTAAAFLMFAGEGCEYAVIECCMGGLLDTTNAVNRKELAVITSISLEHTAYLGDTLGEIALHKAGIINGCRSVISRCVPQEVRGTFFGRGAVLAAQPEDIEEGGNGTYFSCGGRRYFTKMLGCMQPYNAALAISAAEMFGVAPVYIERGIAQAEIGGRLQVITARGRDYILDGAHNPESFIPLVSLLKGRYGGARRTLVYGCLGDKDIKSVLRSLKGCAEEVIAVRPPGNRAMSREDIIAACSEEFSRVRGAHSVGEALSMAECDVVAVCGTFTILKEAKEWIDSVP